MVVSAVWWEGCVVGCVFLGVVCGCECCVVGCVGSHGCGAMDVGVW